jgi:uncharacterized protein YecE (DUF72 family)
MSSHQQFNSTVRIGCSGWQYKHWRESFYPADLPTSRWFAHYASRFDTVEVNNTFYRLPEPGTFKAWRKQAPKDFVYAVKASRFLTHMKKLKDPAEPLQRFFERATKLGPSLGPVLYQLPPNWPVNVERLAEFLDSLPGRRRHTIEFRDPSWYNDVVFGLLEKHRVALCLHDMAGSESGRLDVGPFVYVRFHGTTKYGGRYTDETLASWAGWLAERVRLGRAVYAYFNNDAGGHAPRDAIRLREAIRRAMQPTPESKARHHGGHSGGELDD